MAKITALVFDEMARRTNDPFAYIMATVELGIKAHSDKVDIVNAWNKYHKDKRLPLPR